MGECGCSQPIKNKIETECFPLTQFIHPLEAICQGGIYYLESFDSTFSLWPVKYGFSIGYGNHKTPSSHVDFNQNNTAILSVKGDFNLFSTSNEKRDDLLPIKKIESSFKSCNYACLPLLETQNNLAVTVSIRNVRRNSQNSAELIISLDSHGLISLIDSLTKKSEQLGLDYVYKQLTQSDLDKINQKIKQFLDKERKSELLGTIKNDIQSFYYTIKTSCRRKKYNNFTDRQYKAAQELATEAENWFQVEGDNSTNYDVLEQHLNYYKAKFEKIQNNDFTESNQQFGRIKT